MNALLPILLSLPCASAPVAPSASVGAPAEPPHRTETIVVATLYPLAYFAERIGGTGVRVDCPLPPETDAASWMPDAPAIRAMQSADLILLNGAGLEAWLPRVSLPRRTRVETSRGFRERWLAQAHTRTHSHGPTGTHTHGGTDGTTWLDPLQAEEQALAVLEALCRARPAEVEALRGRFELLASDLRDLDARLRDLGTLPKGEVLLSAEPAYRYLARRYGWRVVSVDWNPGAPFDDLLRRRISDVLEGVRARHLLWNGPVPEAIARRLREEFELECVSFARCEHPPEDPQADYVGIMRANIDRLRVAFPNPAKR